MHHRLFLAALLGLIPLTGVSHAQVFQANGIKIGEVDQNSAFIWTRLTLNEQANKAGAAFIRPKSPAFPLRRNSCRRTKHSTICRVPYPELRAACASHGRAVVSKKAALIG